MAPSWFTYAQREKLVSLERILSCGRGRGFGFGFGAGFVGFGA
jgi:hypothetical protein